MDQKPSLCRMVIFRDQDGVDNAAMVVAVNEFEVDEDVTEEVTEKGKTTTVSKVKKINKSTVNLVVWSGAGVQTVQFGVVQGTVPGTWRWPTKV